MDTTDAQATLDTELANVMQQLDQARKFKEAIAGITGEGVSKDKSVWVKVGSSGALEELELESEALADSPEELSEQILSTINRAKQSRAKQIAEIADEVLGKGSSLSSKVHVETDALINAENMP